MVYIGVIRDVKRNTNSAVKEIAAGVGGGGVGLLVIVAVSVSLAVWLCVRKRRSKYDGTCVQFLIHDVSDLQIVQGRGIENSWVSEYH